MRLFVVIAVLVITRIAGANSPMPLEVWNFYKLPTLSIEAAVKVEPPIAPRLSLPVSVGAAWIYSTGITDSAGVIGLETEARVYVGNSRYRGWSIGAFGRAERFLDLRHVAVMPGIKVTYAVYTKSIFSFEFFSSIAMLFYKDLESKYSQEFHRCDYPSFVFGIRLIGELFGPNRSEHRDRGS